MSFFTKVFFGTDGRHLISGAISKTARPSLNRSQNHREPLVHHTATVADRYAACRVEAILAGADVQHETVR